MALDEDDRRVAALYGGLLRQHGHSYRALDWASADSQAKRFRRLAKIGLESGQSILDVGCGLGDLLPWLRAQGLTMRYTGIDISPDMVRHCRTTHPDGRFIEGNILSDRAGFAPRSFDWVVASGVFAHRKDNPWAYMTAMIGAMVELADRGLAFNAQSTLAPHPERWRLFHADPKQTDSFCRGFGWASLLTHDPGRTDFTVHMWRPETGVPP